MIANIMPASFTISTVSNKLKLAIWQKYHITIFFRNIMILSRFFVMLVLLFCKLSEEYSQMYFPYYKDKPFNKRMAEI